MAQSLNTFKPASKGTISTSGNFFTDSDRILRKIAEDNATSKMGDIANIKITFEGWGYYLRGNKSWYSAHMEGATCYMILKYKSQRFVVPSLFDSSNEDCPEVGNKVELGIERGTDTPSTTPGGLGFIRLNFSTPHKESELNPEEA